MTKGLRVVVTGGRDYDDRAMVSMCLNRLLDNGMNALIHGACRTGADQLAEDWFQKHSDKVGIGRFPADWRMYGKMAGPIRNQKILNECKDINLVLAFPGGRGTADMRARAEAAGIPVVRPWTLNDFLRNLTTTSGKVGQD